MTYLYKCLRLNLGLASRSKHSSDWLYPVDFWRGKDRVNQEALKYWFGDYDELRSLFGGVFKP
jgi:hypothetical protein